MKQFFNRSFELLTQVARFPIFWIALVFKVLAGSFLASEFLKNLFVPFLSQFIHSGFSNPWDYFLAQDPSLNRFPYSGLMLWLFALPLAVLPSAPLLAMRIPMIIADLGILLILCQLFRDRIHRTLIFYWCSPALFYISYVHGQLDVVPTLFLFVSFYFLFRRRFLLSGLTLGMGIAAKFHLVLVIPFVVIYLIRNSVRQKSLSTKFALYFVGFVVPSLLFIVPFLSSPGYQHFVLGTGESLKLFDFKLNISTDFIVYLAPAIITILFLRYTSVHRLSKDLFLLFVTLAYGLLVLFTPSMPGWYYWTIPLLAYFFIQHEKVHSYSYWVLNAVFVAFFLLKFELSSAVPISPFIFHLLFSVLFGAMALNCFWVYRLGIRDHHLYQIKENPFLIGIGGDSGAGKDTFADEVKNLLCAGNWIQNNGDDYHKFERNHEQWKVKTHLDPESNEMYLPVKHIMDLKNGKTVFKRTYDHATGKFTPPVEFAPKRFVLFSGLHPFFIGKMRDLLDLKIYIEPEEKLRRVWKIERDQVKRGHSKEQILKQIEARKNDSENFIAPQRNFADWVISYKLKTAISDDYTYVAPLELSLQYEIINDYFLEDLVAVLTTSPLLKVQVSLSPDLKKQLVQIDGKIRADEIKAIAEDKFPDLYELIGDEDIVWMDNYGGINQLFLLNLISQNMKSS